MRKIIGLSLIICFICILSSCDSLKHEHIVDDDWSYDESFHWKNITCTQDRCLIEYATYKHEDLDNDNMCDVCGYTINNVHNHTWTYHIEDEVGHFKTFTCGCLPKEEITPHADFNKDGFCDECSYRMGEDHPVKYTGCETGHSMITLCGCCEAITVEDPHLDSDGDLLCDICGYTINNVHNHTWTYHTEDETGHFKTFTCGCPSEEGTTPHGDFNKDGFCDECNYEMGGKHPVKYLGCETGHSMITLCGCCEAPAVEDQHVNTDGDLLCDICNYELKDNKCTVNHSFNDGVYVAPKEPTPGDEGEMIYTCNICGYEERVNLPQVFSFTITFGFDGYYNSSTGELKNGYNHDLDVECKTTLNLTDEEIYKIYGIFYIGSIIDNTSNIYVSEDVMEPSYTIKISYSINYEEHNFNIYGATGVDIEEWVDGRDIGYAYYKVLNEYIKSSDEYKKLPPNTMFYE